MHVKTILCQPEGFYISSQLWNDPNTAVRARRGEWRYIGSEGWYATQENKRIYHELLAHVPDLPSFHPGEYDVVDLEIGPCSACAADAPGAANPCPLCMGTDDYAAAWDRRTAQIAVVADALAPCGEARP